MRRWKMRKKVFPKRIEKMIRTGWERSESSKVIAARVNKSATAKRLGVEYKPKQIAAKLGYFTLRDGCLA